MAKSFPVIDFKCNECGEMMRLEIEYEDEFDRWTLSSKEQAHVFFKPNANGWALSDGNENPDYCGECKDKKVLEQVLDEAPIPKPE